MYFSLNHRMCQPHYEAVEDAEKISIEGEIMPAIDGFGLLTIVIMKFRPYNYFWFPISP